MEEKVLFSKVEIEKKVKELAGKIASDYKGRQLVLIGVLAGSFLLVADISKELWEMNMTDFEVDFVKIESYGNSKQSNKNPKLSLDVTLDIGGKDVLIVEDIVQTGHTLSFLKKHLWEKRPSSVKICTLLLKDVRESVLQVDYLGWEVDARNWVEGYGMDSAAKGRGRPFIVQKITD